jgi:signal transduction histidine kinase
VTTTLAGNVLLATAYVVLGWLGLHTAPLHLVVAGIWPAAGLAVAMLFISPRLWPGVWVGAFAINAMSGIPWAAAALMGAGNLAGGYAGAQLLTRAGLSPSMDRLRDVGAVAMAAIGPSALSAATGITVLVGSGQARAAELPELLAVWWSGDALGVLLVAPALLITNDRANSRRFRPGASRMAESAALILALAALTFGLFSITLPYVYAVFPLTALIAYRLGAAGAAMATLVVAGIATTSTVAHAGPFVTASPIHNLFLLQLFLGLLAFKGLVLSAAVAERRAAERETAAAHDALRGLVGELSESRDRLGELSRHLLSAHETERRMIARGLHDDVGQTLTAIKLGLEALRGSMVGRDGLATLNAHVSTVDGVIQSVRDLSFDLHPAVLDDLGLASALRQHADRLAQGAGFSVDVDVRINRERLPPQLEAACFRIVQEALSNVVRHARATHATVTVDEASAGVTVTVRDDGVGFDVDRVRHDRRAGIGILGLHERAALAGGTVEIRSGIESGTEVVARFPARPEAAL